MKTRKSGRWLIVGVMFVAAFGLMAPQAGAIPMTFDLQGVDTAVTAHVVFGYVPDSGTITIDLTNTSPAAAGPDPRTTAFAFNAPSNVSGVGSFIGPSGWSALFTPDSIDTPGQFGKFDVAGVTGSDFNGGDPNDGIKVGSTSQFQFVLTGSNLNSLTESSFLSLFSFEAPPPNEAEQYFIARFQRVGVGGEDSDVAIPTGDPTPVPEPATLLLLGSGLLGLGFVGRKRQGKKEKSN